ncbi:LysR substrate-binding domain-containing protein [Thioclava sp. GXIMD2076]|uniref:LysR substrate-binding domain-containing protein n=1 Tax=Thioclava sp. GXIMD2076 TaxID=3131931 RepID=UPI0030CCDF94
MARPNIKQIEAFNAVMKGGSVTRAAEVLFLSQPAVSKLVHAFEASCGLNLFLRGKGRLTPTPEARRLFAETEKFMSGVERVEMAARAIRDAERGDLTIAAFPALSLRMLPRVAARFLRERPEVDLTLLTRNSPEIATAMLSRMTDFGISLLPTREPGLRCRPFADVSMVCALPPEHPLAAKQLIDLRDLEGIPMINLGTDDLSRRVLDEALAHVGSNPQQSVKVEMADAACMLAAHGQGAAIVPSLATLGWEKNGLVFRPLAQEVKMTVWLYTSAWEPLTALAQHLLGQIREEITEVETIFRQYPSAS